MTAGILLFAINDALGKWLVATYSVGQVLLIRSLAALVLLTPFIWRDRASFAVAPRWGMQSWRAVLATAEVGCFYWAVSYLPLADVMAYYLAGPIFVTAIAGAVLGEPIGWRRWTAVAVGFIGVLVCLRPGSAALSWPALIALAGSFTFSLSMISTRTLRGTSDTVLVTSQTVAALAFGAVLAPLGWMPPSPRDARAAGAARHGGDGGACLRQPLAQARAGQHRGAVPVHDDRLGGAVRLSGVRRRAGRLRCSRAPRSSSVRVFIFLRERALARRGLVLRAAALMRLTA